MSEEEQAAADAAAAATEAARVAAAAAAAEEAAKAAANKDVPTAEEVAELQRQLAEAKAAAAKFKGIDPEKAKRDAAAVAAAEQATRDAEKAQAEAEGNFEKLRELQNAEADARVAAADAARVAAEAVAQAAEARVESALRAAAFATSAFVNTKTILTSGKAERLFGDHVEIVDGQPVVYTAPAGAKGRTIIMNTKGDPLPFDAAIQKVIEADPDKDHLLKSVMTPGAGSKGATNATKESTSASRQDRIAAGLKALKAS